MVVLVNPVFGIRRGDRGWRGWQDHDAPGSRRQHVRQGSGPNRLFFPLAENSGLALTRAKYYHAQRPLIQRDYRQCSFFDYYYRKDTATRIRRTSR